MAETALFLAVLQVNAASGDEMVLSVTDYEALRTECKRRAYELDDLDRRSKADKVWPETSIRDTSCCCHPLTAVP